ncbi:hypothetical protein [Winogradskyella wichelsiae]|uniref:hypothetical protein n=1 Tax=Winogradskyella wichelsiae TaxID=2697007 RepID=UPI0015CAFB2E|nr:hypothetical protein [Winogradskyella wichelsiae]
MKKSILKLGKALSKNEQKQISGGTPSVTETTPGFGNHYPNCPNPWVPCDSDLRDCRFPFHVNSFGRCTL